MKIVILHPHFAYPRGASRFVLEVGERLAKKGRDVLVVTIMADQEVIKPFPHLKFYFLGGSKTDSPFYWFTFPFFQWRLHKFLDTIPDKILFPQVMPANWWAFIYKKFHPNVPLVWMCQEPSAFIHSPMVIESLSWPFKTAIKILKPILAAFDLWLFKESDFVMANSKYGASLIKKIYNRRADGIAYPSVDVQRFKPGPIKEKYIFTISRLDKQKRIDLLIKAYAKLPQQILHQYFLFIAGEGREKQNLTNLARELEVSSSVRFLGSVREEDLPGLYAKASLVIFPAIGEPFGIVPLEAMACGTSVIANRGGGTEETILDGETGILVDPNNIGMLSEKIFYLLANPKILKTMREKARSHMENNFSWETTTEIIEKCLMEAETKITSSAR